MHFLIELLIGAGVVFVLYRIERIYAEYCSLKKSVSVLEVRFRSVLQFVCESKTLRGDATSFILAGYNCKHDLLNNSKEKCICSELTNRINPMLDYEEFCAKEIERHPEWEQDDGDPRVEAEEIKRFAQNREILLPYLKKLAHAGIVWATVQG